MNKNQPSDITEYEDIYANIRTVEERGAILAGIESILDALYRKDKDVPSLIETNMPRAVVVPLKRNLLANDASLDVRKEYLEGLQNALQKLQVLSLEIAFDPTEETITTLINWVRKNIGSTVIMDISLDRTLLAGGRISYEGRYKEINLARLVEEVVRKQRNMITQLLGNRN